VYREGETKILPELKKKGERTGGKETIWRKKPHQQQRKGKRMEKFTWPSFPYGR